ncbi:MAG TPA: MBL fold metallo-hydrolase [Methanothrix sp.]|nr:MBL fold metallo-hydrolase [Methanothrix sp.]HPJ85176.1 MBL fold metallo-hydrolase [Methanothrix sp.]HPR66665.1 MBL fold metallo-hydrolase [Methanothrix sp.]
MLAEISVLAEGYVEILEGGRLRASPSAVLIEDAGTRLLVDPGADRKGLLSGLARRGLSPEDVDLIFVTHTHLDHIINLRLFPETDVCDSSFIYRGDEEIPCGNFVPGTEVEVLPTPGHTPDHASLLVTVENEVWLVAGDLFWWRDDAVQRTDRKSLLALEDESATDPAALMTSRMRALARAEVVIPGHGKVFRPCGRF